jgi:hypothetical protein
MRAVTAAAVPRLGDWCSLHFLPQPGVPDVEIAHRDPAKVRWAQELQQRFGYDPDAATGVAAVIRTGVMEFIDEVDQALIDAAIERAVARTPREELQAIVDALELTSVMTVPLRTKRGVIGAMQFVSAELRPRRRRARAGGGWPRRRSPRHRVAGRAAPRHLLDPAVRPPAASATGGARAEHRSSLLGGRRRLGRRRRLLRRVRLRR